MDRSLRHVRFAAHAGPGQQLLLLLSLALGFGAPGAADDRATPGEVIYREGRLPDGTPLRAERGEGLGIEGAAAACAACHRRSGLGGYEGRVRVPPIIGPYLFRDRETNIRDPNLPHLPGFSPNQLPYSEAAVARAVRTGIAPGGRTLSPLMPRYAIGDAQLSVLIDYLRKLSAGPMPGVSATALEFATVVTPDSVPADRAAMTAVLERYFALRNARIADRVQDRQPTDISEYRAYHSWHLHVWELTGAPQSWGQQLHERQAAQPVFAVMAGLGRADWAPVHRFCEQDRVPCLFPNVDLPIVAEQDYYPLYYSRGVLLEADLIGMRLESVSHSSTSRLVQIYRSGDVGAAAAASLSGRVNAHSWLIDNRPLAEVTRADRDAGAGTADLSRALRDVRSGDTLALWLRPADIAALGEQPPTTGVYVSGLMAGLESAPLPLAWRRVVQMSYPFDPPARRRVRMNFPYAWLQAQKIPVTNDRLQSNTYLTCQIVDDVVEEMLDSFIPDYLLERLEFMLSRRSSSGYFPRLGMAGGQRFVSKGGYIVGFTGPDATGVAAVSDWLVP